MPKFSKATAMHQGFPGLVDAYEQEVGDWTVDIECNFVDMDQTAFFKGAPDDLCQAHHMGYVIKGKFGVRKADGTEEVYEAGEAFVIEPGHVPLSFADSEFVAFTPTVEAKQQMAYMMPNLMQYAKEHGIEIPGEMTPA